MNRDGSHSSKALTTMQRVLAILALGITAGCAHAPVAVGVCDNRARFDGASFPLQVQGTVQELRPDAVHIDFDWGGVDPDGVCVALHSPEWLAGTSIWLYYNDATEIDSRGIAVGKVLRFTLPSSASVSLPFVDTVPDLLVVAPGDGE